MGAVEDSSFNVANCVQDDDANFHLDIDILCNCNYVLHASK